MLSDQQIETMFGYDEDERLTDCPMCGGPGMVLGALGTRVHHRCRNCGWMFSHEEED